MAQVPRASLTVPGHRGPSAASSFKSRFTARPGRGGRALKARVTEEIAPAQCRSEGKMADVAVVGGMQMRRLDLGAIRKKINVALGAEKMRRVTFLQLLGHRQALHAISALKGRA
eukprot:748888-Hanusia_phi.AAC.2